MSGSHSSLSGPPAPAVLKVDSISMQFGGLLAVDNFSLTLRANDLFGLIGPNGAGKTTIFNMITGVYKPTKGQISLGDSNITDMRPSKITTLGMSRTFQNIRLFKDLTVLDNIRIACHFRTQYGLLSSIFRTKLFHQEENRITDESMHLLQVFGLESKAEHLAKNLPYGEQRLLEMARAMATRPKIILLDEPAAGMNPQETIDLTELIFKIRKEFQLAILLIEHDMKLVMSICERVSVVDHGVLIAEGTPHEIQKNKNVIEAYLGAEHQEI